MSDHMGITIIFYYRGSIFANLSMDVDSQT